MQTAAWIAGAYGTTGAVVALAFVLIGVARIDEAARGGAGAWIARLLWMPGLVLLWPVVLARWITLERAR